MTSTGATYTIGSGGRRGMGMCVREVIRNTPKSMYILTVDCFPRLKYCREHVGRIERASTGTQSAVATVTAVRRTLATAVCTVAAASAMFCSQGGHDRGTEGGLESPISTLNHFGRRA